MISTHYYKSKMLSRISCLIHATRVVQRTKRNKTNKRHQQERNATNKNKNENRYYIVYFLDSDYFWIEFCYRGIRPREKEGS